MRLKAKIAMQQGVDIKDSDIDRAHRVGRKGYAPRQMIIKFKSYRAKLVVMKNR